MAPGADSHCWADPPRTGLGNRLVPWAEAVVCSRRLQLQRLHTHWPQLKIGPLLRGERDLQLYTGLFRSDPDELGPIRSLARRARLPLVDVAAYRSWEEFRSERPVIFRFHAYQRYFLLLGEHAPLLRDALRRITRGAQAAPDAPRTRPQLVTLHVRRGDFSVGARTPLEWFVACIEMLERLAPRTFEYHVYSDGGDAELAELLRLGSVTRAGRGSALADLWGLASGRLLLASGYSSFSAWASFLGGMTTWTHPERSLALFGLPAVPGAFVGPVDPARPGAAALDAVSRVGAPAAGPR